MLRVQHLAGYGLEVPDVSVAEAFYTAFGLTAEQNGSLLELSSKGTIANGGPPELVILKGEHKRLHHLSFAIRPEDVDAFAKHLTEIGTPPADPPFGKIRDGLWFRDPWNSWINLVPAPGLVHDVEPKIVNPRVDRHYWRELPTKIEPNRLGHLLIFTQDYEEAEAFFVKALGFVTSDRALGKVSFLAGGQGVRDHHCFGLINSTHRGIQHSSFQVDSIDAVGMGALQMRKAGYTEGFGVGRHALASNLFHYTRDPWGSWVEYYADMDKISDDWESGDWQSLPYIWPDWAPEFWNNEMNANHEPR